MLQHLNSSKISAFVSAKIPAALLRIFGAAFIFFGHGLGKLTYVINGNFQFLDPLGLGPAVSLVIATFAEAICAFLVFIGYRTRLAALVLIINMTVAVLFVHLGQTFGDMELPLLYLLIFICVFLLGPGTLCVDSAKRR